MHSWRASIARLKTSRRRRAPHDLDGARVRVNPHGVTGLDAAAGAADLSWDVGTCHYLSF